MESQDYFKFYPSSVLTVCGVKIIDFAQAQCLENEVDVGYMRGINTLITLMRTILDAE